VGEPILLLRLEGPMQSWGIRARWDVRDTGLEPTKSGVIGLIGCAMGLRRTDPALEELDQSLRFGVRVDRPGVISTDYQTVTGYHRTASGGYKCRGNRVAKTLETAREYDEFTVVSHREYLYDARFLVGLAVCPDRRRDNPTLLEQVFDSLTRPKWPLYLGRKSCVPSRPLVDRESMNEEYASLEDALRHESWEAHEGEGMGPRTLEIWIECMDGGIERQDALRVNRMRNYDFRQCKRIEVSTDLSQGRAS